MPAPAAAADEPAGVPALPAADDEPDGVPAPAAEAAAVAAGVPDATCPVCGQVSGAACTPAASGYLMGHVICPKCKKNPRCLTCRKLMVKGACKDCKVAWKDGQEIPYKGPDV